MDQTQVTVLSYVEPPSAWVLILNGVEVFRDEVSPYKATVPPWRIRGTLRDIAAPVVDVELRDVYGTTIFLTQVNATIERVTDECNSTRFCEEGRATIEIHEFLPAPGDDDSADDDSASE